MTDIAEHNPTVGNAIVSLRFTLDIPESVVQSIVAPESPYEECIDQIEEAVLDDPSRFLEYVNGEPDVDADA